MSVVVRGAPGGTVWAATAPTVPRVTQWGQWDLSDAQFASAVRPANLSNMIMKVFGVMKGL
jgi:hypothetical protein